MTEDLGQDVYKRQDHVLTDIYLESKGLYPINGGQYGIYYIDSSSGKPVVIAAHEWSGFYEYPVSYTHLSGNGEEKITAQL